MLSRTGLTEWDLGAEEIRAGGESGKVSKRRKKTVSFITEEDTA